MRIKSHYGLTILRRTAKFSTDTDSAQWNGVWERKTLLHLTPWNGSHNYITGIMCMFMRCYNNPHRRATIVTNERKMLITITDDVFSVNGLWFNCITSQRSISFSLVSHSPGSQKVKILIKVTSSFPVTCMGRSVVGHHTLEKTILFDSSLFIYI